MKIITRKQQAGVSMVETIIAFPVMLVLGLGIIHLGLVYQAKANLEYAALMAARVGSVTNINIPLMTAEVGKRMAPSIIGDSMAIDQSLITIQVLNPTIAMFDACGEPASELGVACVQAQCEIPNFGLQYRPTTNDCGVVNIQDANVLRIKVTYRFNSMIPFMNVRLFSGDDQNNINDYTPQAGMNIHAVATVRMQSPARYTIDNSCCFAPGG
ncbi:MAG: TadE/TadG family type IV pilus assembly protein [Pseudomonadota bacterium]